MGVTASAATRRTSADEPSIWIGCLHHYNCGSLVGHWFSAIGADEVTLADVHAGSGHGYAECEELWGLDIENIPVNREMSPMEAARWGELYDEVGAEQWSALCAYVRTGSYVAQGDTDFPALSDFEEAYCGEWESFRDYAYQYAEDLDLFDGLPEDHPAVRYFNWGSWIADLESDFSTEPTGHGGIFIFRAL